MLHDIIGFYDPFTGLLRTFDALRHATPQDYLALVAFILGLAALCGVFALAYWLNRPDRAETEARKRSTSTPLTEGSAP